MPRSIAFDIQIEEPVEDAAAKGASARRARSTSLTVRAGSIQYGDPSGRVLILDFERRRRMRIDRVSGRYADESLFSDVGLRHFELLNRAHIRRALEAGGGDGSMFAPVIVEHQLSITDTARTTTISDPAAGADQARPTGMFRSLFKRKAGSDIETQIDGEHTVYSAGARRLLSHAGQGLDAPAVVAAGFAQFVRYEYGGHPLVLARAANLGVVPRQLHLHALQPPPFDRGQVTLTTSSLREAPDDLPRTQGLVEVFRLDDVKGQDAVLDRPSRQGSSSASSPSHPLDQCVAAAIAAIRSGDALVGILSFFELTLETGVAMPAALADAVRSCTDARVSALLGSLGPPLDEASARLALATQLRLRDGSPRPSPALDAFEARLRTTLGERKVAKELLARAITANPRLVGAYKELGDAYLSEYDAKRAWRCWDIARSIAPAHPLLLDVAGMEQMLVSEHPEYFG